MGSGESHILLGGGGAFRFVISQTTGPISKIQQTFDSSVRELSKHGVKFYLEVTDDVTGQVKVRMFQFSGLVTSASTISMLSANSQWIGKDSVTDICKYQFLCFVTIIQVKLNVFSGHQVPKKGQAKKGRDLELRYMF